MINCSRCELCAAASEIFASGSFVHYSLLFRLVVEPLCILGISLLTVAIFHSKALHFNARLLLLCMTVSMTIANIGVFLDTVYTLFVSFVLPTDNRCEYQVFHPEYFLRLQSISAAGGLGLATSTIFLAMERVLAAVKYESYEKKGHKWVAILLCTIQTIVCVVTIVAVKEQQTLPFSDIELSNTENAMLYGTVLWCANLLSLLTFSILWIINQKRTRTLLDSQLRVLSTRYQLRENILTTRLMVPVMLIVALMTTSSVIVDVISLPTVGPDTAITPLLLREIVDYAPFSQYQISLMPISTILMLILLPMFSTHIKRSLYRISHLDRFLNTSSTTDVVTAEQARDVYFQKLQGQWQTNPQVNHK